MATYLEISELKQNDEFKARLGVAIIKYAAYVLGNTGDTAFREQKVYWARRALISTDEQVFRLMGFVIADGTVQAELGGITDAQLQGAVEWVINSNMSVLV